MIGGISVITIVIILFYIGVLAFGFLGISLLYNGFIVLFWMWKSKYDKTNTNYERNKIILHSRPIFFITPIMLVIALSIFLYNLPISFEKIAGNKEPNETIYNIHILRDGGEELLTNKDIIDKNQAKDIINILHEYKYRKSIQESRFGNRMTLRGTEIISINYNLAGTQIYKFLDLTNEGYIYDSYTGQGYKIVTDNKKEFFNRLVEVISRKK